MPIKLTCDCGKALSVKDELAGKRIRCPACQAVVTVPDLDDGEPAQDPKPAVKQTAKPKKRDRSPISMSFSLPLHGKLYWLLLLALLPLGLHILFAGKDDTVTRLEKTVEKLEVAPNFEDDEAFFKGLPNHKIEGAALPRDSKMQWLFGLCSCAFFFVVLFVLFPQIDLDLLAPLGIGFLTGTLGILLLLGFQFLAEATQGRALVSRSIIVMFLFWVAWIIGFSYRAAIDPETGFVPSLLGYTFGVGLCEEVVKALPLLIKYRKSDEMPARVACMWGFASGVGFGVAEAIMYAGDFYNGLATTGIYWVRFVSCVALHGIWTASAGIFIARHRHIIAADFHWFEYVPRAIFLVSIPMLLHGLYDTLLKKEYDVAALVVGLVSFLWLAWQIETLDDAGEE